MLLEIDQCIDEMLYQLTGDGHLESKVRFIQGLACQMKQRNDVVSQLLMQIKIQKSF